MFNKKASLQDQNESANRSRLPNASFN